MANPTFTFQEISKYITKHGGVIPAHYFQSAAFPVAIDFVNSKSSEGRLVIVQGRKSTGMPLVEILKDKPENKEENRTVSINNLKMADLKRLSCSLCDDHMVVLRKNTGSDTLGPIAGYLVKAKVPPLEMLKSAPMPLSL